ncbi:MAG: Smr/MutS family protein [Bdellovibrionales bacterium]|jgi:DNA-nicking Smr family endonuclease
MSSAEDQDIWGLYAKGVKRMGDKEPEAPLQTKSAVPLPQAAAPLESPEKEPALQREAAAPPPSLPKVWNKEPLDLRIERNMSLGDVFIEAKLDLHGQTEAGAYESFKAFVETQSERGKRMLLVITGKGALGTSVLRSNLPRWCAVPPFDAQVLAVRTAAQHHGGDGAYYVLLRKRA